MTSSNILNSLVVVDPRVSDYQRLTSGVSPKAEVLVLDPAQDGVEQITKALAHRGGIESLHILSHGCSGAIQLGSTQLSWRTLRHYTAQLQSWAKALKTNADILLYACEVAASELGKTLVQQMSVLTGATIAASCDLTGSATLGGNWNLEFTTGQIKTPLAFQPDAMAAYPGVLITFLNETFANEDVRDNTAWLFGIGPGTTSQNPFLTARDISAPSNTSPTGGGLPGTPAGLTPDPDGQGVLRLTNNTQNQAAFVLYNKPIDATAGLEIDFRLFSYGGNGTDITPPGADGISFFLLDGNTSPTDAGAFGGSLGYAQKTSDGIPGIEGGYVGVGFDEYGNFANPTDTLDGLGPLQRVGGPGRVADAITIRGEAGADPARQTGYNFLTTSGSLPFGLDVPGPTGTRENSERTFKILLSETGLLTVSIDLNNNRSFNDPGETLIDQYSVIGANGAAPSTFKFGFAAGTGQSTNFHEIRNLLITTPGEPPVAADVTASLRCGQTINLTGQAGLSATDTDGTIASFTITTLPATEQGTLFLGNPANGGTRVTAQQVLTPAEVNQLYFRASGDFTGSSFTYTATDNDGDFDETPATVTLLSNNVPPETENFQRRVDPKETVRLDGFEARDQNGEGSIESYTIATLPSQGALFLGNPENDGAERITAGKILTPQQINRIFFRAPADFERNSTFTYTATDDCGAVDLTPATVTLIPSGNPPNPPNPPQPPDDDDVLGKCLPGFNRTGSGNIRGKRTNFEDTLRGRGKNDTIRGLGCTDILQGRRGNDRVIGGTARDFLDGNQGRDKLNGNNGNDVMDGGLGFDSVRGGKGADRINGRRGNDTVAGLGGNDNIRAGRGGDTANGGPNADFLHGEQGNDYVRGAKGQDTLNGGLGDDRLRGNQKRDRASGQRGNDTLRGEGGPDTLRGQRGNDRMSGGTQADRLLGGFGDDVLIGRRGPDNMSGGAGRDRFVYRSAEDGFDLIRNFNPNQDVIDLRRVFSRPEYSGSNLFNRYVRLDAGNDGAIVRIDGNGSAAGGFLRLATLRDITVNQLSESVFVVS